MTSPSESQGVQTTPIPTTAQDIQSANQAELQERGHAPAGYPPAAEPRFSEREWKEFRDDDVHAGGAIVCLMAGIFFLGLMLYTTIAIIVGA